MCRVDLPDPGFRCLYAERAIRKIELACEHEIRGCTFKTSSQEEYDSHLATCLFRPVACPMRTCGETRTYGVIMEHLREVHNAALCEANNRGVAKAVMPLPVTYASEIPIVLRFHRQWCLATLAATDSGYSVAVYKCSSNGGAGQQEGAYVATRIASDHTVVAATIALADITAEVVQVETFTFNRQQANRCRRGRESNKIALTFRVVGRRSLQVVPN